MTNKDTDLYFIALLPPQEVSQRVHALKLEAKERFDTKQSLKSPPHITLHMPFKLKPKMEADLMSVLHQFASRHAPLLLKAKGFNSFAPAVIFVDIVPDPMMAQMQQELLSLMTEKFQLFNGLYKDKAFHPHMTIAFRDLRKAKFLVAWEHFKDQSFADSFCIENLSLLKHDGSRWQVFEEFAFSVHTGISQ